MVVVSNQYLTKEEMTINAQYILDYLAPKGWSKNAVCGMLGNMETESTINPGLWEGRDFGNPSVGYGLVQWTPSTKYTSWAVANGYSITDIDGQLDRLDYELANGIQWIATSDYPLSFEEFKVSNETPEFLAQAFLRNYERPKNQNQPNRSTQARYWFNVLVGEAVSYPAFPTTEGLPITSGYGWRANPITGQDEFHASIDISGQGVNHPIYATQTGEVYYNRETSYGGWTVRIRHTGDSYYSQYQHLSVKSPIPIGTMVQKGEVIGTMGNTGDSTGIHLDFQVAKNENGWFTEVGTIDPEIYLQMGDGGGVNPPVDPVDPSKPVNDLISLLLCDALNGWKY